MKHLGNITELNQLKFRDVAGNVFTMIIEAQNSNRQAGIPQLTNDDAFVFEDEPQTLRNKSFFGNLFGLPTNRLSTITESVPEFMEDWRAFWAPSAKTAAWTALTAPTLEYAAGTTANIQQQFEDNNEDHAEFTDRLDDLEEAPAAEAFTATLEITEATFVDVSTQPLIFIEKTFAEEASLTLVPAPQAHKTYVTTNRTDTLLTVTAATGAFADSVPAQSYAVHRFDGTAWYKAENAEFSVADPGTGLTKQTIILTEATEDTGNAVWTTVNKTADLELAFTLRANPSEGDLYNIRNSSASTDLLINGNGHTIQGEVVALAPSQFLWLIFDGTAWRQMENRDAASQDLSIVNLPLAEGTAVNNGDAVCWVQDTDVREFMRRSVVAAGTMYPPGNVVSSFDVIQLTDSQFVVAWIENNTDDFTIRRDVRCRLVTRTNYSQVLGPVVNVASVADTGLGPTVKLLKMTSTEFVIVFPNVSFALQCRKGTVAAGTLVLQTATRALSITSQQEDMALFRKADSEFIIFYLLSTGGVYAKAVTIGAGADPTLTLGTAYRVSPIAGDGLGNPSVNVTQMTDTTFMAVLQCNADPKYGFIMVTSPNGANTVARGSHNAGSYFDDLEYQDYFAVNITTYLRKVTDTRAVYVAHVGTDQVHFATVDVSAGICAITSTQTQVALPITSTLSGLSWMVQTYLEKIWLVFDSGVTGYNGQREVLYEYSGNNVVLSSSRFREYPIETRRVANILSEFQREAGLGRPFIPLGNFALFNFRAGNNISDPRLAPWLYIDLIDTEQITSGLIPFPSSMSFLKKESRNGNGALGYQGSKDYSVYMDKGYFATLGSGSWCFSQGVLVASGKSQGYNFLNFHIYKVEGDSVRLVQARAGSYAFPEFNYFQPSRQFYSLTYKDGRLFTAFRVDADADMESVMRGGYHTFNFATEELTSTGLDIFDNDFVAIIDYSPAQVPTTYTAPTQIMLAPHPTDAAKFYFIGEIDYTVNAGRVFIPPPDPIDYPANLTYVSPAFVRCNFEKNLTDDTESALYGFNFVKGGLHYYADYDRTIEWPNTKRGALATSTMGGGEYFACWKDRVGMAKSGNTDLINLTDETCVNCTANLDQIPLLYTQVGDYFIALDGTYRVRAFSPGGSSSWSTTLAVSPNTVSNGTTFYGFALIPLTDSHANGCMYCFVYINEAKSYTLQRLVLSVRVISVSGSTQTVGTQVDFIDHAMDAGVAAPGTAADYKGLRGSRTREDGSQIAVIVNCCRGSDVGEQVAVVLDIDLTNRTASQHIALAQEGKFIGIAQEAGTSGSIDVSVGPTLARASSGAGLTLSAAPSGLTESERPRDLRAGTSVTTQMMYLRPVLT